MVQPVEVDVADGMRDRAECVPNGAELLSGGLVTLSVTLVAVELGCRTAKQGF